MYSSENLSKGQIIYFFNYKPKAIKEVLSTANEKHFFLQCQLKPFWLLFDTPTYTVKYLFTLYRFPKTLSPSLNLPSSLKPTQHSTDSQEEKGSGTTATGFHLSISYSGVILVHGANQPVAFSEKRVLFLLWLHLYTDRTAISKTWLSGLRGTVPGVSWASPQSSLVLLWPPGRRAAGSQITQRVGRWHSDAASDSTVEHRPFLYISFFFFVEPSWNRYPLEDDRKSSTVSYWLEELGSFKAALLSLNLRAGSCPPLKTTVRGNHLLQPGLNSARVRSAEKKRWRLGSFHPERREKSFTHSRERTYWF